MYYRNPFKHKMMGPLEAFSTFWIQYANAHDRASRSEYWWNFIFIICAYLIMSAIASKFSATSALIFNSVWMLLLLIPAISITIRRFHDIDTTGVLAITLCLLSSIAQLVPVSYATFTFLNKIAKRLKHPIWILFISALIIIALIIIFLAIYCMGGWLIFPLESLLALGFLTHNKFSPLLLTIKSTFYKNISHALSLLMKTSHIHTHISIMFYLTKTSQVPVMQWITLAITVCCGLAFLIILLTPTQASRYGTGHGKDIIM